MGHVLFHSKEMGTPHKLRWYKSLKGAKIGMKAANRNAGHDVYRILEESAFDQTYAISMNSTAMIGKAADSNYPKNPSVDQGA